MATRDSATGSPSSGGPTSSLSIARLCFRAEVQRLLDARSMRCAPACLGWFLDHTTGQPVRCDECASLNGYRDLVADVDMYVLPAVHKAMVEWLTADTDDEDVLADAERLRGQSRI